MQAVILQQEDRKVLLDAQLQGVLPQHAFTTAYWRTLGALSGPLGGRGGAWRIRTGNIDWVLRFYRRGGLPGKLFTDGYFYTGLERTRAWREWRLLARMHELQLPVPTPVAASVQRAGLAYRAAIITATLPGTAMAERIRNRGMREQDWRATGNCIRRFHDAGIWHADLNANNILIAGDDVYLIDFDRGRFRDQDTAWRESNLARLQRSLEKLFPTDAEMINTGMQNLRAGYNR